VAGEPVEITTIFKTVTSDVQAHAMAVWEAYEVAVERIRDENEAKVDLFLQRLQRPMTSAEHSVFLRAQAGLDVPPDNPLDLQPHSTAMAAMCAPVVDFVCMATVAVCIGVVATTTRSPRGCCRPTNQL
jgi:hypothetical protein